MKDIYIYIPLRERYFSLSSFLDKSVLIVFNCSGRVEDRYTLDLFFFFHVRQSSARLLSWVSFVSDQIIFALSRLFFGTRGLANWSLFCVFFSSRRFIKFFLENNYILCFFFFLFKLKIKRKIFSKFYLNLNFLINFFLSLFTRYIVNAFFYVASKKLMLNST